MIFHANKVTVNDDEDLEECWWVGFVDDEHAPQNYLLLQRGIEDDEQDIRLGMNTYHVELNGQGWSCYGGIEALELQRDRVYITFTAEGVREMGGVDKLEITFAPDGRILDELRKRLANIFAGTECLAYRAA